MSAGQSEGAATRPSTGLPESRVDDTRSAWIHKPEDQARARDIVRLFQCRFCSLPLKDPVTLPCGRSLCRRCLPEIHDRVNITYPAEPERSKGLQCPFLECGKEHALGDCGSDVILNKAAHYLSENFERGKRQASDLKLSTKLAAIGGETSDSSSLSQEDETAFVVLEGGKLVATWRLAEKGELKFEADVKYRELDDESQADYAHFELDILHKIQEEARTEMDCHVCFALFWEPLTTACGHTFCRPCLQRILDHSRYCPVCRRKLAINPLLNRTACPANDRLTQIIKTFWVDELEARKETLEAEQTSQHDDFDIPLFVCTLSFPMMPTFLHIFEPRYRLMIRRAMDGDRTFGMVLPSQTRNTQEPHFHELGTLLRITNVHYYPDGRSLIETFGVSRFRVLEHGTTDGYAMGKIERIDDVSLEEEEASEAHEALPEDNSDADDQNGTPEPKSRFPETVQDIETMSTQSLMDFALDFVARMRAQSVPWLAERMLTIYGECPTDPAIFPWWLASMLPVRDVEKYRLLGTSSVRDRLKICCVWIVEWDSSTWSVHNCVIL